MAKGPIKLPHAPRQLKLPSFPTGPSITKFGVENRITQNGKAKGKNRMANCCMPDVTESKASIKSYLLPQPQDKSLFILKTNSSSGVNRSYQNSGLLVSRKTPGTVVSTPLKPASRSKRKVNQPTNGVKSGMPIPPDTDEPITKYFPVRKSCRQTQKMLKKEKEKNVEKILLSCKDEGLRVEQICGKGRGVVATRKFNKGEFVVEYSGELIEYSLAKHREKMYAQDQNIGCYMYYFKHNDETWCVDATEESGRLGRLINHSRNGNLVTKLFTLDDAPRLRLILVAKQDINSGDELLYDYGDRDKESLEYHPWLAF